MGNNELTLRERIAISKRKRKAVVVARVPRECAFQIDALAEFKRVSKEEIIENALLYAVSKLIKSLSDEDQAAINEMVKRKMEVL